MTDIIRCPWQRCSCTHTAGCVAGWIDSDEKSIACPICRPDVAALLDRAEDVKLARAGLPGYPRPMTRV